MRARRLLDTATPPLSGPDITRIRTHTPTPETCDMADPQSLPSRYHSQRRNKPSVDEPPSSPPEDDALARSKSRYRPRRGTATSPPEAQAARPPTSQSPNGAPSRYHSKNTRQPPLNTLYKEQVVAGGNRKTSDNAKSYERELQSPVREGAQVERRQTSNEKRTPRDNAHAATATLAPLQILPAAPQPTGELFPPLSPPPADMKPTRLDGPPQSGNIRATKSMSELPHYSSDGEAGCFMGLFKRRKAETIPENKPVAARPKTAKDVSASKPSGPGVDAPISAINAGDRYVLIECGKTKNMFPVTPSTTPVDLIKSAATCMSERIDVKSALLLEYFSTVGVQRPLRRYEHIRDVMNSWDNDKQNSLLLVDPGTGTIEAELTVTGVPRTEPEEQSWLLSYSQKVGKWDKRVIILRPGGQVVCLKDPDKPNDAMNVCHLSDFDIYTPTPEKLKKKIKPPKKLCYAIKSQQKSSLFESTENFVHFFSTSDRETADSFYYSIQNWRSWYLVNVLGEGKKEKEKVNVTAPAPTKDRSASNDRTAVHRAKESLDSHYQLGSFQPMLDMDHFEQRPSSPENAQPGSSRGFKKSSNQFDVNVSPERRTSSAKRQNPPLSLNNKMQLAEDEPLANLNRQVSGGAGRPSTDQRRPDADFREGGLLGRNYSQRRREQNDADDLGNLGDGMRRQTSTRKQATNSAELKRTSSTRGGHARSGSSDLERSGSRRQKPKPLIDLTPQFREPPQHYKKGKGFHPDQPHANGLIANATTPEDPLGLPQSTVFRSTSDTHSGPSSPGLIDLTPQHQEPVHHAKKGRGFKVDIQAASGGLVGNATSQEDPLGIPQSTVFRNVNAMPESRRRAGSVSDNAHGIQRGPSTSKPTEAFTGEGLLATAQARSGWGAGTKGRGVIDGSRAGGRPLVDLTPDHRFVQGSLLNKVERAEGIPAPIIDRERRD